MTQVYFDNGVVLSCQGPEWRPRRSAAVPGICGACAAPLTGRRLWFCASEPGDKQSCRLRYLLHHDFDEARREVLRRVAHQCVRCGSGQDLEVNHIVPRMGAGYGIGCWNHQENLEVLCRGCHVVVTNNVYPLVDRRITCNGCVVWLQAHNLEVPPKSACTFCPYSSINAWKKRKRAGGPDWEEAVQVDEAIRLQRTKQGHQLFVHPARKPLAEAVDIPEDHQAHQTKLDLPCDSGYCFV